MRKYPLLIEEIEGKWRATFPDIPSINDEKLWLKKCLAISTAKKAFYDLCSSGKTIIDPVWGPDVGDTILMVQETFKASKNLELP